MASPRSFWRSDSHGSTAVVKILLCSQMAGACSRYWPGLSSSLPLAPEDRGNLDQGIKKQSMKSRPTDLRPMALAGWETEKMVRRYAPFTANHVAMYADKLEN